MVFLQNIRKKYGSDQRGKRRKRRNLTHYGKTALNKNSEGQTQRTDSVRKGKRHRIKSEEARRIPDENRICGKTQGRGRSQKNVRRKNDLKRRAKIDSLKGRKP